MRGRRLSGSGLRSLFLVLRCGLRGGSCMLKKFISYGIVLIEIVWYTCSIQ